ncbi:sigma-70 family RNA polymerase sigma factor [Chitinophaga polysaccharea]|uniref:RNA polymerase sigma factor n=1 Tax=Chitinophaga TaxID=79328 RepID=UPI001455085E|nr:MULTISPECIES: sigma-70 family RNA polymerase sigma factor [Chitinophaga]NLR59509.1 sigma-70 family RNA polymerase sigma factor [Chitinophaga polysaccharea]NLU96142.1 sigma-70 family RNA polymerase sigma factor [Chitinophaga sp. Ak27]
MNLYSNLTDQELIRLYIAGNNQAFTTLVHRHKNRIFTTIVLLVRDRNLAEDILQEVFIKIVNALQSGQYVDNSRFLAWAVRISHNACISHFRKAHTRPQIVVNYNDDLGDSMELSEHSQEHRMIKAEIAEEINVMLDRLPRLQREVLILRYYADLSYKEIAQTIGISINTALGRVRYALVNLRKQMGVESLVSA